MKRPKSVTWLAIGVLSFTGLQLLRLVDTITQWDYLETLPLSISTNYFALSGLFWCVIGLALGGGLWRGKSWAARFTQYAALAFTIYYWIDQLFLGVSPLRSANYPFSIGMTVFLLALIYWILSRTRAQLFFGETHEQGFEDSTTG